MANNFTAMNVGVRRFCLALGEHRNFEPGGVVQYVCAREGMIVDGSALHAGDLITLGSQPDAVLETWFNAGMIDPQS